MPLSHLPWTLTPVATRIWHSASHSDMTTAHCVIPSQCCESPMHDSVPNIAQPATTPILPRNLSQSFILGGWNAPARFPNYVASQQSANWAEKCESLFTRCTLMVRVALTTCPLPVVGSILSAIRKPSALRNHNDTGLRIVQVLPREA